MKCFGFKFNKILNKTKQKKKDYIPKIESSIDENEKLKWKIWQFLRSLENKAKINDNLNLFGYYYYYCFESCFLSFLSEFSKQKKNDTESKKEPDFRLIIMMMMTDKSCINIENKVGRK